MTRLMLDSATAADIPFTFRGEPLALVAGYVDGPHRWTDADWQLFAPNVRRVRICIWNDRMDAQVIDIEPRNNDAKGAVPWIRAKWARGEVPTVYCFSDAGLAGYRISDARRECDAAGVKRPLFWIAKWDDDPSTFDPSGDASIVAKQYAGSALTGGHFDASVVADHWPGVDLDPASPPRAFDPRANAEDREFLDQRIREVVMNEEIAPYAVWVALGRKIGARPNDGEGGVI